MFKVLIVLVLFISAILAINRPTNYYAGSSAGRGDQQQINGFAAFNITSNSWNVVIPPQISQAQINGMVSVGGGLLAYGSFQAVGAGSAASLAFWDGKVWSAPEGVGIYKYNQDSLLPRYQTSTTGVGTVYAAVVSGNDVYVFGDFNQVGLVRGNVAGFVKLTWTTGNIFTISTVGNGYNQMINGACSSFCPYNSSPLGPGKNKLKVFTYNGVQTFVYQTGSDVYTFQPNTAAWIQITASSGARNLLGNVKDFDIDSAGNIYVVGKFDNTLDANPSKQYLHIAVSPDAGTTWNAVSNPQPLPLANFQPLSPLVNQTTGQQIYPGLDASGLTAIYVESAQSIYVAGGMRVAERNVSVDNTAGQMQTRVFQIVGQTLNTLSERFGSSTATLNGPEYIGVNIYQITKAQGTVFVWGNFDTYRYIIPSVNTKFGQRYSEVMKGASALSNGQWNQAFGGYITTSYDADASPTATLPTLPFAFSWNANQDTAYFLNIVSGNNLASTYSLVSGSLFGWGGDKSLKQNNKWNAVLGRQRFVTASNFGSGFGADGSVNALHLTKRGDALILGGQFDFIGSQTIGGVAWYNSQSDTVVAVGGGLFYYNNNPNYGQDLIYNNRIGGIVWDFEEKGDYLYAGGQFNRNNSGSALYNIASIKFRQSGAGWNQIDGGCDNIVRDLLIVGNKLYIGGDFLFCGLIGDVYNGNLQRGRVPTSHIAVVDLGDSKTSWRNLGVGVTGGSVLAMAYRNGQVFVGGTFTSAGGKLYTNGIARWYESGQHWEPVIAKCRGLCDRANNIFPYIGGADSPNPTSRRPIGNCLNLREFDGIIYCIDSATAGNLVAYFDSNTWYQATSLNASSSYFGLSNTLISRNATQSRRILISPLSGSNYGANGANLETLDQKYNQLVVTYGGFSQSALSFSSASSLVFSTLFLFSILFAYFF